MVQFNLETSKVTKGDLWTLGEHRLMCGDCTDEANIKKLLGGEVPDMVFTDPPYQMKCGKKNGGSRINREIKEAIANISGLINFNPEKISFLSNFGINTFYIFTSKDLIPKYFEIFKGFNFNILIWLKSDPLPLVNYSFIPEMEYLLYFSQKGKVWTNGLPSEIYKKCYCSDKMKGRREAGGKIHPTIKPQKIIRDKIQISSNSGGIVLDPFCGSGSTLIACEALGRRCYAMEIEPKFCDVIIKRWQQLTGMEAVRADGVKFKEL